VALSLGSPPPAVSRHRIPVEPGLSSATPGGVTARATWFAIGRQGVLSLTGWTPSIQTRFHVSGLTQVPD